ncbi:VOC family protein [Amphritea pacifica]|uniref:VOC family protein n=1 Tax=Amphritea pacifica TaxID=2811233 RepID=A0ABS2W9Z7_9GAMM|nr:VOC family protein [Amphritea pacifica]MBN0988538.1 VOC family protein [Amphritea pacifica]MBN1006746.1 VOC family protein [Amphritea pacifica]
MLAGVHHVAIICSDYPQSKHFYVSILGLEVIAENYRAEKDSYKLDLRLPDGGQIELFSFPDRPARPSYPEALGLRHLAFSVHSIDAAVMHLKAHGITAEPVRTDEYTGKQYTFFSDPDNLPLELYQS